MKIVQRHKPAPSAKSRITLVPVASLIRQRRRYPPGIDPPDIAGLEVRQPHRSQADTHRVAAPIDGGAEQLATVVRLLDDRQIAVDDIGLRRPTLDEVFLALTGQPIDDATDPDPAATAA